VVPVTTTPRRRQIKPTTGYKIPPDIKRNLDRLISDGEFVSYADMFTAALRFWVENRKLDIGKAVEEFLVSEGGQAALKKAMKKK